ncbi:MAG TPA: KGG domain-containing protein [Herpetosiphonaceae bacterium]
MAEKEKRGFASMDRQKQREIASKGGRAAHALGTAHEFTSDEARAAGRKGGEAVSRNRQHMAEIGRRGGQRSRSGTKGSSDQSGDQGRADGESGLFAQEAGGQRRRI